MGVARQYTGTVGNLTTCQVTGNGHYAERTRAWPVATRLSLPQAWAEEASRRQPAPVPEAGTCQTKAELALALLEEATAWGVGHACGTGDADYGDNPNGLKGLAERQDRHVVAVRANVSVTLERGTDSSVLRADAGLAAQPLQAWQPLAWSAGANGWWRAKCLALRGGRVEGEGTRHGGGLIGQRPGRGQTGDWQYCWSDFPATTPLAVRVEYAPRRHGGEPYPEEAQTALGWDQYPGRRWEGFPQHALTGMLSYSFLVWWAWREREQRKGTGRPRAALSPAPGPSPGIASRDPSPGERMAAGCRHP